MTKYFKVNYRSPGHWDICDGTKRLCKIRGGEGNFCVYNDYGDFEDKEGFKTITETMEYICNHLMENPNRWSSQ